MIERMDIVEPQEDTLLLWNDSPLANATDRLSDTLGIFHIYTLLCVPNQSPDPIIIITVHMLAAAGAD